MSEVAGEMEGVGVARRLWNDAEEEARRERTAVRWFSS
jgi:predicted GNAT family acetyltransferase